VQIGSGKLLGGPKVSAAKDVILTIHNSHIEECGTPPKLALKEGRFTCYFENIHGEQFIMQFDSATNICHMWSGDVGWEEELRVEEFRGRTIVRFARSKAERDAEFKMNKQFDHGDLLKSSPAEKQRIKDMVYDACRKAFGKPKLTTEECEYVSNCPQLSQDEVDVIRAYYGICKRLRR
jgi:hypothetical protein